MNTLFNVNFRQAALCLAVAACILSAGASCTADETADGMIAVQGIGYPPIRAESPAQAHLMAKRAAVVSAYRNAVAASAAGGNGRDVTYEELSGFVKGLSVVEEEYLKDGGIRITAKVPKKNIAVSSVSRTEGRRPDGAGEAGTEAGRVGIPEGSGDVFKAPERVSLDEWYKIISNLVRIEK
ncbi:MAG: hypothetical protein C0402_15350 [Thermodesulfovibrio sp.]|nr:hypothetical protein [Thermodesulfovibrio sp.]